MEKGLKQSRKRGTPAIRPYDEGMGIEERINVATGRVRNRAAKKRERHRTGGKAMGNMELRAEWDKHLPSDAPRLTFGEAEIARFCWKRHIAATGDNPSFLDVMVWSLQSWSQVMGTQFRTMASPPEYPAPRFFVKCIAQFMDAYKERKHIERYATMTTKEQLIDKLVRLRGKDKETAEREVNEKLGLSKLLNEIAEERKKLQRLQNSNQEDAATRKRISMLERTAKRREAIELNNIDEEFETWI